MDMGQCNDAYSAIRVAVALAEAFRLRCKRTASFPGAFLVRAESGLHPADPAAPGNQKYSPGPKPAGLRVAECAEFSGRAL